MKANIIPFPPAAKQDGKEHTGAGAELVLQLVFSADGQLLTLTGDLDVFCKQGLQTTLTRLVESHILTAVDAGLTEEAIAEMAALSAHSPETYPTICLLR